MFATISITVHSSGKPSGDEVVGILDVCESSLGPNVSSDISFVGSLSKGFE